MQLYFCSGMPFEASFENAQWRKAQQMQPMWLCVLSKKHQRQKRSFEDGGRWKITRYSWTKEKIRRADRPNAGALITWSTWSVGPRGRRGNRKKVATSRAGKSLEAWGIFTSASDVTGLAFVQNGLCQSGLIPKQNRNFFALSLTFEQFYSFRSTCVLGISLLTIHMCV